jgi:hypothetical protein
MELARDQHPSIGLRGHGTPCPYKFNCIEWTRLQRYEGRVPPCGTRPYEADDARRSLARIRLAQTAGGQELIAG